MSRETPLTTNGQPTETALRAYLLGTVAFEAALGFQRRLVDQVAGNPGTAALVVCEHPPLITVGRQGSWGHILCEPHELARRRWPVRWVNRGGDCWLHLPGQLAVYPILPLGRLGLGVQEYLNRLQEVVAAVLEDFNIGGERRPGQPGVWVGSRRIASLGVAVRDWVSYYGLLLNVNPDLKLFRLVRGSATEGAATSLERERRGPLRMAMVRERIVEHFAARFHFARTSLFFDSPALRRKAPSDAFATPS
jgi:lipoyl(octanoyl) transferase